MGGWARGVVAGSSAGRDQLRNINNIIIYYLLLFKHLNISSILLSEYKYCSDMSVEEKKDKKRNESEGLRLSLHQPRCLILGTDILYIIY